MPHVEGEETPIGYKNWGDKSQVRVRRNRDGVVLAFQYIKSCPEARAFCPEGVDLSTRRRDSGYGSQIDARLARLPMPAFLTATTPYALPVMLIVVRDMYGVWRDKASSKQRIAEVEVCAEASHGDGMRLAKAEV